MPALAGTLASLLFIGSGAPANIADIRIVDARTAQAVDEKGNLLWEHRFGSDLKNFIVENRIAPQSVVREHGQATGVVLMTANSDGPETIWYLRASDGGELWSRTAAWNIPRNAQGNLEYAWNFLVDWPGLRSKVIAVGLFDGPWYSSAVQFLSLDNRLLGEYDHPGHIWVWGPLRRDADGKTALLLYGDNSSARFVRSLVPEARGLHCGFVALLEPPQVDGQAFPYSTGIPADRDWPGVQPAEESSYLLIPPFSGGTMKMGITEVRVQGQAPSRAPIEAWTADDCVLKLEPNLHPVACFVRLGGLAEKTLAGRASVRVLFIRSGARSYLEVPIERD